MNLFNFRLGKLTVFAVVLIILFAPVLATAQLDPTDPNFQIVPDCGEGQMCGFCELLTLGQNIMNFLIFFAVLVAVLMFVYAGFLLLVGGSSEGQRTKAKKVFYAAVMGLVLTLASWLIINLLMSVFLDTNAFTLWSLPGCPGWIS